ncbi:hypothetical protein I4U23_027124 [Adineta vaga]|nr:hypothetical protein I4U23_027124 [Adineta vaga]
MCAKANFNINIDAELLKLIESKVREGKNIASKLRAALEVADEETGGKYNIMVSDLSQITSRNLIGKKFHETFEINNRSYGVWIFVSGTFTNTGERGYDYWIFRGKHDFTDGQKSSTVTFEPRR